MRLRELKIKDAPLLLEWMHDAEIVKYMHANFQEKTIRDAEEFIRTSRQDPTNAHYAIVSETDEYMGTVSLKQIENGTAEFGLVVRKVAMNRGYAWFGMEECLKNAFEQLNLECVYWCVSKDNQRAIRFYNKHQFHEALDIPETVLKRYQGVENLTWYSVLKGDTLNARESVAGCRVIHIKTIPTLNAGELSFYEAQKDVPFEIKRIYYITKVPEGTRRGFHAHKALKQLLFCPYGRIQLILDNKNGREEIELSDPSIGVLIEEPTWREMLWLQTDSVLCVAASEYYQPEDYIRDYDEFRQYLEQNEK